MLILAIAKINFIFAAIGDTCTLDSTGQHSFFAFPHWWKYLDGKVDPAGVCSPDFHFPTDIWPIVLGVIDMLLRLAGLVAIISIIISGIMYITAQGDVGKTASARSRIYNSLIGLAIVSIASGLVTFIGNQLGG